MLRIGCYWALVCALIACGADHTGSGGAVVPAPDDTHTDFLTPDESSIELDCIDVQLGLEAGDCETELASVAELAQSPRCWPEAESPSGFSQMDGLEVLAARVSGKVVAEQPIYERIVHDLGAIGALWPDLAFLTFYFPGAISILIETDRATMRGMRSGSYEAWDCLNTLFRVSDKNLTRATMGILEFGGAYDLRVLAREYQKLPGISRAYTNSFAGDWGETCVVPGESEWHYLFDQASGDCPSGCIDHLYHHFVTLSTGEVKRDGMWKYNRNEEPPDWFTTYHSRESCY